MPYATGHVTLAHSDDDDFLVEAFLHRRLPRQNPKEAAGGVPNERPRVVLFVQADNPIVARERAELADKMQQLGQHQELRGNQGDSAEAAKPVRGRWLSMLGLKDVDDES